MANTILLRGAKLTTRKEANCGSTGITPGMLVEIDASSSDAKPQTGDGARCQVAVAFENEIFGNGIDVAYIEDDQVLYDIYPSGSEFLGYVAAATSAIANRAFVTPDGAGGLKTGTAANGIGIALEAVDNSGGSTFVRIKVEAL